MEVSVQEKENCMDETCEKSEFSSQSIKQIESDTNGNHKYVKQVSTSPPVVLIQTDTGEENDKVVEASWPLIATEKPPQPQQQPQQQQQQPFVLLQSDDMNEMNLVLRLIREKFPNVRINLYEQDEQCMDTHTSEAGKQHKSDPSRNKINKITTINRNSLSATYNLNDRTRLSQSTSRSNLDNMERQESRDSGFWSVSKCSFESMKSLSISDSPHAGQKAEANGNNHAANSPTMGNQSNVVERTSNAPTPTPVNPTSDNDTTKSDLAENDLSNDMSSNTSVNEAAPSTAKSPLNDWKKWKKKQAWRYNSSSSNLSQYDAPNESSSNNNLSSGPIYGSNSFDGTSLCSYGMARSAGRENQLTPELAYQQHHQHQTPGGQQHQVPSLGQMHNYSNSFESALRCTPTPPGVSNNLLTANAHHHSSATVQTQLSHLNPWASTSKLDIIKNEMATSSSASSAAGFDDQTHQFSKGQKRRGKLVRDRTIDNPDEHQTLSLSNLNNSSGSVNASGVKTNESAAKIATSISPDITKSFEDQSKESTRQQVNNVNTQMASMNGRISPPEKRVSLHLKTDIDEMSCRGKLSLDEIDKSQRVIIKRNSFKSQDSSLSISPPPPTQLTKASSLKTTTNNTPSPTTSSCALNNTTTSNSSSLSSSPSPSSLQEVMNSMVNSMTAAAFAAAVASSASATPTSSSIDNLPNQYDFYKELQAKLSIKTNEPEEPNNLFTSMYSLSLSKNNNTQKPSKNSNQNLASDHTNNNNYHHSSSSIDTMTNTSSSDQHYNRINVMRSLGANFNVSTGNSSTGNYLSQSSNKSMCRSNSSPSYSIQSTPGNPNSTGPYYPPNLMSSYMNYPPYSLGSSTYQLNQNHNPQQSTPIQQLPFNYNMNKTGPPLPHSYFYSTFSPKLSTTVPTVNRLSPYFYDANPDINNNKPAGTTSSPRQSFLNNKPPEIVITESKSENEPNDYGPSGDGAKMGSHLIDQNNYVNCFKLSPGVETTGAFGAGAGGSKLTTPGMMLFDGKNRSGPSRGSESSLESGHRLFDEWRANFSSLVKSESQTSLSNKLEQQQSAAKSPSSKLIKPHICTSCQKRFARSDMLIRHSRLHSGVRPYRCNRCGQEFSRSDHLNTHLRTHTGEKPYSCPHPKCTYAACRKDMITRHMKVHNKTRISLSFDADNNKSLEAINKMMTLPSISFDTSSINSLSPAHTPVPHANTSFSNDDHLLSSAQSNKS